MRPTTSSCGSSIIRENVTVGNLGMLLVHEPNSLPTRLSALSYLQNIATKEPFNTETIRSTKALATGLYSYSPLVKQKCIFALGQSRYPTVVPALRDLFTNKKESVGCRVNAARGLSFFRGRGDEHQVVMELLTARYDEDNETKIVRDAAEFASARLGWEMRGEEKVDDVWDSITDSAPPFPYVPQDDPVQYFSSILHDESESLFSRCRAMSNLRNLTKLPSSDLSLGYLSHYITLMVIRALTSACLHYQSTSVFLRCQLIVVLGQIKHKMIQMFLVMQLRSSWEDELVRAAAAEAMIGIVGEKEVERQLLESLTEFERDDSDIVRDCVRFVLERAQEART